MRRALYYSNYSPDPKLALKYYKIAIEQCESNGLDPFSDGVLGIKIQLAAWLEKIGSYKNSIDVLESLLRDCQRWVDKMEMSARDGLIGKDGNLLTPPKKPESAKNEDGSDVGEEAQENLWGKRTRVLGKSVGISVKLGELYADEHVLQSDAAGERLVWAVETVLKELQRRQTQGVKEGEGEWMSPEQVGGALEGKSTCYRTFIYTGSNMFCSFGKPLRIQGPALSSCPFVPSSDYVVATKDVPHCRSEYVYLVPEVNNLLYSY